ncbi:ATP-dependent DNA helicase [Microtetraspora sp. NBRC 13810]|uniref:ATP-dependent helicase n=1 Tax=Microtetraspora sp. NBRC 13810 TaxID=3030990 RepID=UPI002552C186|nr:ATP-dependent DNA helicase [Microtetraspora sp. NBRC 13810]
MLDEHQRAVVEHESGPLLVLAGPGTGKTTTIVESVVDRVDRRGLDPERVLVLTFSRKAAGELRERITGRMRRTTRTPLALTFHSYANALLRREAVLAGDPPPRLLTGPEQLLEVRRLLHGELEDGAVAWPSDLREALKTRGFAEELRDFLSRAAERGLDDEGLIELGRLHRRPDWTAAGRFLRRYQDRFDLDPVPSLDYAELIRAAAGLLTDGEVRARERAAYDVVFVDEYQDTDPAQEFLLSQLAGDGRDLIAVGDPDQSIYGFRGADVGGIVGFPERFRTRDGREAPVVALQVCRRMAPEVLTASRRITERLPAAPLPSAGDGGGRGHRDLLALDDAAPGEVRVLLADSASQEAAVVADTLRRAHLLDGVPWARMAVLVRSAARQLPLLRRALTTAGVPVMVASDEVPLAAEPGVRPFITLLRMALHPADLDEAVTEELLTGPLGGTDMIGVRRLRRALRIADNAAFPITASPSGEGDGSDAPPYREGGGAAPYEGQDGAVSYEGRDGSASYEGRDGRGPSGEEAASYAEGGGAEAGAASRGGEGGGGEDGERAGAADVGEESDGERRRAGELLVAAVRNPGELAGVEPEHVAAPARRLGRLLGVARKAIAAGGSAEDVLWAVWEASGLAQRWSEASVSGGARGAQADRDLDAVVALFDHAARFVDRLPKAGPEVFLEDLASQEIAGDTLAEHAPEGDAVRILTAHRAKGLEWEVVVVAGVQEGIWPDLRLRGSMLGVEDMVELTRGSELAAADAAAAALTSKLLAEERRLFYVAATRAKRRLVVTAVGGEDTDERPSRFLNELLPGAVEEAGALDRARWLSMSALVADLRQAVCDAGRPEPMRMRAARHLARLAEAGVPGAHPDEWYGLTPISDDRPLGWPDDIVRVSPSAVESFTKCGLRWLLETSVGAGTTSGAQGLGNVIHALAVIAASGMPGEETLAKRLDDVWHELDFGGVWYNRKQRVIAEQMLGKFVRWQEGNGRELVATEEAFTVSLGEGVQITGRVDRVERDERGRAVIIDIKTGSAKPADTDLDRHPQLGVYQLAALLGAFRRHELAEPGGAALVQVGKAAGKDAKEQSQRPLGDDEKPGWARDMVDTVALGMSGPFFQATVNDGCRTCAARGNCPVNDDGGQVC